MNRHFYFVIFNRLRDIPDGSLVADLPAAYPYIAKLVPGSEGTAIAFGEERHDGSGFDGIRVHHGGSSSEITDDGILDFVVGQQRIVYTTRGQTVGVDFAGTELWRKDFQLLDFSMAAASSQVIGAYDATPPRVVHIDVASGSASPEYEVQGAPWAVEISPDGSRSFVALKGELVVFKAGEFQRRALLPVSTFATADILDSGEIVVGAADAQDNTFLLLLGPEPGMGLWLSDPGPRDPIARRPYVKFQEGSTDFIAVEKDGLSSYNVVRSL